MPTPWEKNLLAVMHVLPLPGGLIDVRREGDEIIALHWGWTEGDEHMKGWFDSKGNAIPPPGEIDDDK